MQKRARRQVHPGAVKAVCIMHHANHYGSGLSTSTGTLGKDSVKSILAAERHAMGSTSGQPEYAVWKLTVTAFFCSST